MIISFVRNPFTIKLVSNGLSDRHRLGVQGAFHNSLPTWSTNEPLNTLLAKAKHNLIDGLFDFYLFKNGNK